MAPTFKCELLFLLGKIDCACRTELLAGPAFAFLKIDAVVFIYAILQRHGLRVLDIDGLARDQVLVVGIIHLFRAFFSACPAGNTLAHVHKPGMLEDAHRKIARFAADVKRLQTGSGFRC